ncbi:MAG TPA: type II CAAX endopeptidase family protein [Capsulimonadaceae bacterium]|nr:type II CAAX endopeptidase family protein [Capsulimonadaceae bacterium]
MAHSPPQTMTTWQRFWDYPITRIFAFLFLFLAIMIGLSVIALLDARTVSHLGQAVMIEISIVAEAVAVVLAFSIMVRLADKRSLDSAGFAIRGLVTETTTGYLIGVAMLSVVIGLMAVTGVYHVIGRSSHFHLLLPLGLFLCVAVAEETMFRGYIFQTLEKRWGSGIALIGSSLAFGIAHVLNTLPNGFSWQHMTGPVFICFEAGVPLAAGYMLTRRLWLPIGLHWAWNFFEGPIYGADVSASRGSGLSFDTLYQARFTGPPWLTGGAFGPEASVIALIVGTIAGLLLLRVAIRAGQWKSGEQLAPDTGVIQPESGEPPQAEDHGKETL